MSQYVFKELGAGDTFSPLMLNAQAAFTQAPFYGGWQESLGRRVRRLVVCQQDVPIAYLQIIEYPLFKNKKCWYMPYGPVATNADQEFLAVLKAELTRLAAGSNVVFVRVDFDPVVPSQLSQFFTPAARCTYQAAQFQPRHEWRLSLKPSLEELFRAIHKNTRYSIRASEKKGVVTEIVVEHFQEYFTDFYRLLLETAKRNNFTLHPQAYYEGILTQLKCEQGYLAVARLGRDIVAIDLVVCYGEVAHYVFAGSSTQHRGVLAAYAAVWAAMVEAKKRGCRYFNFGGVAKGAEHHSWAGLTSFKKKFGGELVTHAPFFDLVLQPLWYYVYNLRKFIKQYI